MTIHQMLMTSYVASGIVQSSLDGITLSDQIGGGGGASVTFNTDGTMALTADASTENRNWFLPTTTSIGSSYWVKWVRSSGVGATSGMVSGTWYQITTNRSLTLNGVTSKYVYGAFYISSDGTDSNIIASTSSVNGVYLDYWVDGIDPCVDVNSFVPLSNKLAGEMMVGEQMMVLTDDYTSYTKCEIDSINTSPANCVRVTSSNGITLVCTYNTPITGPDGSVVDAIHSTGYPIAYLNHDEFGWTTVLSVEDIGERTVANITLKNKTYAAGEERGKYLFTHNLKQ